MDHAKKVESIWPRIGVPLAQLGLVLLFASLVFGIESLIFWIRFDTMPHWGAVDFGFVPPVTHWPNVDRILSYLCRIHLGIVSSLTGLSLLTLGLKIADHR